MTNQKKEEKLAIIKNVRCGVGDRGVAWLQFDTYTSEHLAAMQIIPWGKAKDVIEAYGVSDVRDLNNMPVWVETDDSTILFKRAWHSNESDEDEDEDDD